MDNLRLTHYKSSDNSSDSSSSGQKIIGQNSDSFPPRRTHIDVQTDQGVYIDVEHFLLVMTQRGAKKWQVVIDALRFYAAFLSGNPRHALRNRPHLLALLDGLSEKVRTESPLSLYRSESIEAIDLEKEKRLQALSEKLAAICRKNLKISRHRQKVAETAAVLEAAGYTPADLDVFIQHVWPSEYRYKPGHAPGLWIVEDKIEEARVVRVEPVAAAQEPEEAEAYTPIPAYRGEHEATWIAAQGELKIVIGSRYPGLIGPMKLVAVEGGRFVFVVPTENLREAVKQRALLELACRLESICKARGKLPEGGISVEIYTEEEYKP
jgi:hypothetical protein